MAARKQGLGTQENKVSMKPGLMTVRPRQSKRLSDSGKRQKFQALIKLWTTKSTSTGSAEELLASTSEGSPGVSELQTSFQGNASPSEDPIMDETVQGNQSEEEATFPSQTKRGRGRPRKYPLTYSEEEANSPSQTKKGYSEEEANSPSQTKKGYSEEEANSPSQTKRGRGRPRKYPLTYSEEEANSPSQTKKGYSEEEANSPSQTKRGRGRPRKYPLTHSEEEANSPSQTKKGYSEEEANSPSQTKKGYSEEEANSPSQTKRGRGRPRKYPLTYSEEEANSPSQTKKGYSEEEANSPSQTKRGRGRPRKYPLTHSEEEANSPSQTKKGYSEEEANSPSYTKRGRGRPRKYPREDSKEEAPSPTQTKRGRRRPRKYPVEVKSSEQDVIGLHLSDSPVRCSEGVAALSRSKQGLEDSESLVEDLNNAAKKRHVESQIKCAVFPIVQLTRLPSDSGSKTHLLRESTPSTKQVTEALEPADEMPKVVAESHKPVVPPEQSVPVSFGPKERSPSYSQESQDEEVFATTTELSTEYLPHLKTNSFDRLRSISLNAGVQMVITEAKIILRGPWEAVADARTTIIQLEAEIRESVCSRGRVEKSVGGKEDEEEAQVEEELETMTEEASTTEPNDERQKRSAETEPGEATISQLQDGVYVIVQEDSGARASPSLLGAKAVISASDCTELDSMGGDENSAEVEEEEEGTEDLREEEEGAEDVIEEEEGAEDVGEEEEGTENVREEEEGTEDVMKEEEEVEDVREKEEGTEDVREAEEGTEDVREEEEGTEDVREEEEGAEDVREAEEGTEDVREEEEGTEDVMEEEEGVEDVRDEGEVVVQERVVEETATKVPQDTGCGHSLSIVFSNTASKECTKKHETGSSVGSVSSLSPRVLQAVKTIMQQVKQTIKSKPMDGLSKQTGKSRWLIQCIDCKKLLRTEESLKQHVCKGEDSPAGHALTKPVGPFQEVPELKDDFCKGVQDGSNNIWFVCQLCCETFKTRQEVFNHIKANHIKENFIPVTASSREKPKEPVDRTDHSYKRRSYAMYVFSCGMCKKEFDLMTGLQDHYQTHFDGSSRSKTNAEINEADHSELDSKGREENYMKLEEEEETEKENVAEEMYTDVLQDSSSEGSLSATVLSKTDSREHTKKSREGSHSPKIFRRTAKSQNQHGIAVKESKMVIQCTHCKKLLKTNQSLRGHICESGDGGTENNESEPVGLCEEVIKLRDDFSVGIRDTNKNLWFECVFCCEVLRNREKMFIHIKVDHADKNFIPVLAMSQEKVGKTAAQTKSDCRTVSQGEKDEVESTPVTGIFHIPKPGRSMCKTNETRPVSATCEICGYTFASKLWLKNHQRQYHSGFLFACEICGRAFRVVFNLRKHYQNHFDAMGALRRDPQMELLFTEDNGHFKCKICQIIVQKRTDRYPHSQICISTIAESNGPLHSCKQCNYTTRRIAQAISHFLSQHTPKSDVKRPWYKCNGCAGSWFRRRRWISHLKMCNGLDADFRKPFRNTALCSGTLQKDVLVCPDCDRNISKLTTRLDGTFDHMTVTKKLLPKDAEENCYICSKRLQNDVDQVTYCPNEKKVISICETCGESFTKTSSFSSHICSGENDMVYESQEDLYKCKACKTSFAGRQNWLSHIRKCKVLDQEFRAGFLRISDLSGKLHGRVTVCEDCDENLSLLATRPDGTFDGMVKLAVDNLEEPDAEASLLYCEICLRNSNHVESMITYVEQPNMPKCDQCLKTFADQEALKKHLCVSKGKEKGRYLSEPVGKCEEVPKDSTEEYILLRDKEKNIWYQCRDCPLLLPMRWAMIKHWESAHNNQPAVPYVVVRVDENGKVSYEEDGTGCSIQTPRPPRPLILKTCPERATHKCPHCDFRTSGAGLKTHMSRHHPKFFYKCKICGHCFGRLQLLQSHYKTHTEQEPGARRSYFKELKKNPPRFTCQQCKAKFYRICDLNNHLRLCRGYKPEFKDGWFCCAKCSFKTISRYKCIKHYSRKHEERNFVCEICGKKYGFKSDLEFHKKNHASTRDFKCEVCSKTFTLSRYLSTHMKTHQDIRNVFCPVCNKGFRNNSSLKSHSKVHQRPEPPEKAFKCSQCVKSFSTRRALKDHINVHIGVYPYKCAQCGMKFQQKKSLDSHKASKHSKKPHQCDVCHKVFSSAYVVRNHSCAGFSQSAAPHTVQQNQASQPPDKTPVTSEQTETVLSAIVVDNMAMDYNNVGNLHDIVSPVSALGVGQVLFSTDLQENCVIESSEASEALTKVVTEEVTWEVPVQVAVQEEDVVQWAGEVPQETVEVPQETVEVPQETPMYMCEDCHFIMTTWESVEAHMLLHAEPTATCGSVQEVVTRGDQQIVLHVSEADSAGTVTNPDALS